MQRTQRLLRTSRVLILALMLWASHPADSARAADTVAGELSPTQAAALLQKRYAARVVRVSSTQAGSQHLYVFLLLSPDGKVWTVRLDARTGAEVPEKAP
ncbi:MAG TPA: PepSY domain-containing protein [Steroidobacteraceae bacterium]|jgi:uncharacterized membrane protein YkoI